MNIPATMLKWRRKQKRGAIMKPETFEDIKQSAEARSVGGERAKKIAGAAYWRTARAKFEASKQ